VSDQLAKKIQKDIQSALERMVTAEIVISSNFPIISRIGRESFEITWKTDSRLSYVFDYKSALSLYFETLRRHDFSFLLSDGSLGQLYYWVSEGRLLSHRLCFFPAPLRIEPDELEWILDLDEVLTPEEKLRRLCHSVPIRFDFNEDLIEDHPRSHASLISQMCRIPVVGPLSVPRFLRFVSKHFCNPLRSSAIMFENPDLDAFGDTIYQEERMEMHLHFLRHRL
jgi:hypothetical protein